jgi:hypothetical protein
MLRRVVWWILANVSEMFTASIIRTIMAGFGGTSIEPSGYIGDIWL